MREDSKKQIDKYRELLEGLTEGKEQVSDEELQDQLLQLIKSAGFEVEETEVKQIIATIQRMRTTKESGDEIIWTVKGLEKERDFRL